MIIAEEHEFLVAGHHTIRPADQEFLKRQHLSQADEIFDVVREEI